MLQSDKNQNSKQSDKNQNSKPFHYDLESIPLPQNTSNSSQQVAVCLRTGLLVLEAPSKDLAFHQENIEEFGNVEFQSLMPEESAQDLHVEYIVKLCDLKNEILNRNPLARYSSQVTLDESKDLVELISAGILDYIPFLFPSDDLKARELYRKLRHLVSSVLLPLFNTKLEIDMIRQARRDGQRQMAELNRMLGLGKHLFPSPDLYHKPLQLYRKSRALELHTDSLLTALPSSLCLVHQFKSLHGTFCDDGRDIILVFFLYDLQKQSVFSESTKVLLTRHGTIYLPILNKSLGTEYVETGKDYHQKETESSVFSELNRPDINGLLVCKVFRYCDGSEFKKSDSFLTKFKTRSSISPSPIQNQQFLICVASFTLDITRILQHVISTASLDETTTHQMTCHYNISGDPSELNLSLLIGLYKPKEVNRLAVARQCLVTKRKTILIENEMNSLYITLACGNFITSKPGSIQVVCQARNNDGTFVNESLFLGLDGLLSPAYTSFITVNENSPTFNERFRIDLQGKNIQSLHLFFTFVNVNKKDEGIFAFAFMPLAQNNTVLIQDGSYDLRLYRYESNLAIPQHYFSFPAGPNLLVPIHLSSAAVSNMAAAANASVKLSLLPHTFSVQSCLFSTIFSQDTNLINFIQWKRTGSRTLGDIIASLQSVDEIELVNHSIPVFHAFLDLFVEMEKGGNIVYFLMDSFIFFFSIVDRHTSNHKILKLLTEVNSPLAYKSSLPAYRDALLVTIRQTLREEAKNFTSVWQYLFRVMIHCTRFDSDLMMKSVSLFQSELEDMLLITSTESPTLDCQFDFINHMYAILQEMSYFPEEFTFKFFKSVMNCINVEIKDFLVARLTLSEKLLSSPIFSNQTSSISLRNQVLVWSLSVGDMSAESQTTMRHSVLNVLTVMMNLIEKEIKYPLTDSYDQGIGISSRNWYRILVFVLNSYGSSSIGILFTLYHSSIECFTNEDVILFQSLICSLGLMIDQRFLAAIMIEHDSQNFLLYQIIKSLYSIFSGAYLDTFAVEIGLQCVYASSRFAEAVLFTIISDSFQRDADFLNFWDLFAETVLYMLFWVHIDNGFKQRNLYLRRISPRLCETLQKVCDNCITYHSSILKTLPLPKRFLLRLLNTAYDDSSFQIQGIALKMIQFCIKIDFSRFSNFKDIEIICYDMLHESMMTNNKRAYNTTFALELSKYFDSCDGLLATQGHSFSKGARKFVPILESLMNCQSSHDSISVLIRLLRFLRHVKHKNLFLKYLYRLKDIHIERNDLVEAVLTLRQHCHMLGWSTAATISDHIEMTEFDYNAKLHQECIELLDQANSWERALDLVRILEKKYEEILDYKSLCELLKKRVSLYEKLMENHRSFPSYYKVCFYGNGFSARESGKQYIYRGENWEHIASFTERIEEVFRPVQIISSLSMIGSIDMTDSNARYIQISAVNPISDIRTWKKRDCLTWELEKFYQPISKDSDTPIWLFTPGLYWENQEFQEAYAKRNSQPRHSIDYRESNEVFMFSISKPIKKAESIYEDSSAREFLELWTENTVYFTETTLPFLSRRSRIDQVLTFQISPIENAIIAIRTKTRELLEFEAQYTELYSKDISLFPPSNRSSAISNSSSIAPSKSLNINPFTMALNGAVDAPVNGGIVMYRKAFFENNAFDADHNLGHRTILQQAILDQVQVISRCIKLHGLIVSGDLLPLHESIVTLFKKNFQEELKDLGSDHVSLFAPPSRESDSSNVRSAVEMDRPSKLSPSKRIADSLRKMANLAL